MGSSLTYQELADIIARLVHFALYREEPMFDRPPAKTVDNSCSSAYQIATGVLARLDILVPLDDFGRRYDFTCAPDEFAAVIARNKDKGCGYDTLIVALMGLLDQWPCDLDLRELLEWMGLCLPEDHIEVNWAPAAAPYLALRKDWPKLLQA